MFTKTRNLSRAMALGAGVAVGALVLAGCSASGPAEPEGEGFDIVTEVDYDETAVQELVNQSLLAEVPISDLPAETIPGYGRAAIELTEEQVQTALNCWKQPECTVGDGPVHVGIFNAVDNLWQTTAAMNVILQSLTYPEIGKISYSFVGDLPSAQSAVRSMVADGADIIIGYNAFGAAMAPVFSEAQAAGAKVVTYTGETPDVGADVINNQVVFEAGDWGADVADLLTDDLGLTSSDEVAFFFGTPGNPQDTLVFENLEARLGEIDGPTIGFKQDTDWTRPGVSAAATALIASGVPAKAVINTYTDPMPQVVTAYDQAGIGVPALVSWTEFNDLFRIWEERAGTDAEFDLYYTNALVFTARLALTNGMALLADEKIPARTGLPLPIVKAEEGIYEADLPGDFPGWSTLIPADVMAGMLNQ